MYTETYCCRFFFMLEITTPVTQFLFISLYSGIMMKPAKVINIHKDTSS